jgi:hypothetical protein
MSRWFSYALLVTTLLEIAVAQSSRIKTEANVACSPLVQSEPFTLYGFSRETLIKSSLSTGSIDKVVPA